MDNFIFEDIVSCFQLIYRANRHTFFDQIPYLNERGCHDIIKKKPLVTKKTNFDKLSEDVIIHIFTYLDCKDLIAVSETCCCLYHLSHNNYIWKPYAELLRLEDISEESQQKLNRFYKPGKDEQRYNNWKFVSRNMSTGTATITSQGEDEEDPTDANTNNDELSQIEIQLETTTKPSSDTQNSNPTPEEQKENELTEYQKFRKEKLSNPCIRRRLVREYGYELKDKYSRITKYLNHLKLASVLSLFLYTTLLAVKLDSFLYWSWVIISAPLVFSSLIMLGLTIFLWLPTLTWPLVFYRWVMKDFVGWWTSWAYSLTVKGRITQIITGILISVIPILYFFHVLFPTIIPNWSPLLSGTLAFTIWTYTSTQMQYPPSKFYPIVLGITSITISALFPLIGIKMIIWSAIPWSIVCIPLYLATIFGSLFIFKLSIDLNTSTICLHALYWNGLYTCLLLLVIAAGILIILRADEVFLVNWIFVLVPVYVIQTIISIYYALRTFTSKISQYSFKHPFTCITGGVKNNNEMDKFIV